MADDDAPRPLLALPPASPSTAATQWFAVDGRGQIAMFDADELGPIPAAALRSWPRGSSLARDLLPLLAGVDPTALSYDAAGVFADAGSSTGRGPAARMFGPELITAPPPFDQSLAEVLLELRTGDGARERFAALELDLRLLPSRAGSYAWGHLGSPSLRALWAEGWVVRAALGHALEPGRMGMFRFDFDAELDAYVRSDRPELPVRVHALPTAARARLAAVGLAELDFAVDLRVTV